ncbi:MAG: hypothetical protein K6G08_01260 [Prevotella sp.]|nr:hypothetical protein [Prevotella sp.]
MEKKDKKEKGAIHERERTSAERRGKGAGVAIISQHRQRCGENIVEKRGSKAPTLLVGMNAEREQTTKGRHIRGKNLMDKGLRPIRYKRSYT